MSVIYQILFGVYCLVNTIVLVRSQGKVSLEKRYKELEKSFWSETDGISKWKYDAVQRYLRTNPRNYTVLVFLTAAQERGCPICPHALAEFKLISRSHKSGRRSGQDVSDNVYFAHVDYDTSQETFQWLKLRYAPAVLIASAGMPFASWRMLDLRMQDSEAEAVVGWLNKRGGVKLSLSRPINLEKVLTMCCILIILVICYKLIQKYCSPSVINTIWALGVLSFMYINMGGYMWCQINDPPFSRSERDGSVSYFAGGQRSQLKGEGCILSLVYAGVTLGLVMVSTVNNRPKDYKARSRCLIQVYIGLAIFLGSTWQLFKAFDKKTEYPYGAKFVADHAEKIYKALLKGVKGFF